jgi:pimeloyl-ACP methyl ester carboxylesterase
MAVMSIRGVSLFVEVVGHGYPLALMHGGPGLDHTTLLSLQPLADQFTLVFYDHRCNGRSQGADVASMTWENLTDDADCLRQALGFEKWAVLGHSFGGNVALEYALRYPGSVSHLILMDTTADARLSQQNAPDILAKRGYRPAAVEAARRFFNGQITPGEFVPTLLKFARAYFYRLNLLGMTREMVTGPQMRANPAATIFAHRQLSPGWTVMHRLGEIKRPALVLAGRADFLFPPEHQAILADRIAGSRLEIIECAGHNPHMEKPAEVIRAIRDFMTTQA